MVVVDGWIDENAIAHFLANSLHPRCKPFRTIPPPCLAPFPALYALHSLIFYLNSLTVI
jgi:hypothetical protein